MSLTGQKNTIQYPDKFLWYFAYPIIAFLFVFIGTDYNFLEFYKIPWIQTDILFALAVTYAVGWYIKWIVIRLDEKLSWHSHFKARLLKQVVYGIAAPLCCAMLLEIVYLKAIGVALQSSAILTLELPLSFIFLLLLNLFYASSYLFHTPKTNIVTILKEVEQEAALNEPSYIIVQFGNEDRKIEIADCAYLKTASKIVWLYTTGGGQYRLTGNLEEWQEKLGDSFFRLNRQYLAALAAIKAVEQTETRKLKVHFHIAPAEDVFISKLNAPAFRKWWKAGCPL